MNGSSMWSVALIFSLAHVAVAAEAQDPLVPVTTAPIVYTINYSGDYFTNPDYLEQFKAAPPDLLHMGKAVPISHLWGPTRMYAGENQWTGGPGHTLSWENIALITPQQLAERVENIRQTLRRYHAIGIPEITPYISYHTLAGDHEKRLGFWKFYDQWDAYAKWAGPKPKHDPTDWLVVDRHGKLMGGSCGGYSPDYFAPLHRYRACIRHPDWLAWQQRLVRMVAEVGYDGCFVDNPSIPDDCYCRYCKAAFRDFLPKNRDVDWVRRLTEGLPLDQLTLDSPDASRELVLRFRLLYLRDYLGSLRAVGREINPRFTIFPNGNVINECLTTGALSDRLMFESSYTPGILAADEAPESENVSITAAADARPAKRLTHRLNLDDASHAIEMQAEITVPSVVQAGKPAPIQLKVLSVGGSTKDNDAAEEFHLLFSDGQGRPAARVDLTPRMILGASSPNGKGTRPPAMLEAQWTPPRPGLYTVSLGFIYTDGGHVRLFRQVAPLVLNKVCRTHMASQLFAQHMRARQIFLGYEASRKGFDNAQELSLAEMAAFSGGGGFSSRGQPQVKYRAFFKKHPQLFSAWQMTAPAAVLYSLWGPNPLNYLRVVTQPTIQEYLAETHRPYVTLIDARLPDRPDLLAPFRVLYLQSPDYEMSERQLDALRKYATSGGRLVLANAKIKLNGKPAQEVLGGTGVSLWDAKQPAAVTEPIAAADGRRKNVRFAVYRQADRLALHAVNYNVCLLDRDRRVLDVKPTDVCLPVPEGWTRASAQCFDPDSPPQAIPCRVENGKLLLTLPELHVYKIVLLTRQR